MEDGNIEFWLKRPSDANRKDVKLSMSRSCTQADVKARVHVEYDDRPDAACITLIHGGRVLKDNTEKLQDIFKMVGADILPSLHVVVRNTAGSHAKPQLADAQADRSLSPSANCPQDQHQPSLSQPEMQQRAMQPALGSAAGVRSGSEDRSAPSAIRGSPFARANGAHAPAQPPAQAPLPPLPALIPLGSLGRALSGDVQLQTRGSGASSSGHAGTQNGLRAAQASPSAMPLPTAQLSLPRPQARPQHGPVNAGPTLNASPGSQSEASSGGVPSAMASNPAMALAFSAAFAALTSPSALASIGMQPPHVPLQPPSPSQAQSLLQEQLQQLLRQRDGMPQQPVMGQPYLQPVFPSPVTYMPMVGMVQAPPGSNEQNQQAHYATVLAPMVPMMMPYGMMPYPAAPMPGGQPAQSQAFAHLPPQAAGPAVQQAQRGNDAFPDEALHARPAGDNPRFRGAGADAGARGRPAQVRVRMVQINLRALLQLGVMAIILYQHCPPGRFLLFATIGLALYVTGPAPLRRAWHRLLAMLPPMQGPQQHGRPQPDRDGPRPPNNQGQEIPAHQPPAPAGPAGGRPAEAAPAAQRGAAGLPGLGLVRPRGLLQEVQALVVGFFTSLMPGWNINPEDAAAFAAAQQVVAANQAREAGNNQRRDHQD